MENSDLFIIDRARKIFFIKMKSSIKITCEYGISANCFRSNIILVELVSSKRLIKRPNSALKFTKIVKNTLMEAKY